MDGALATGLSINLCELHEGLLQEVHPGFDLCFLVDAHIVKCKQ